MNYTLRPATLADVASIAEVARYTWNATYAQIVAEHNRRKFLDSAYTSYALWEAIEHKPPWFYVAVQAGNVVGFAQYLRRFDAQGELVRIYVHPDHQRRGIGRRFLVTGLVAMATTGIERCYVSVEVNNIAARVFYERFGFHPHREHGRFLGDQIIRLVEYMAPVVDLLDVPDVKRAVQKTMEQR